MKDLEDLFQRVAALIRETPVTKELRTVSTDDKLRLYGLYKHATMGPCETPAPSMLAVEAYAKHNAWKACTSMTRKYAMLEYVKIASTQPHWLGAKCKALLEEYHTKYGDASPEDVKEEPPKHSTDIPSNISSSYGSWLHQNLGWGPMEPRGQLDINFRDLLFAARQALWTPPLACAKTHAQAIQQTWREATGRQAMVGLSARSLLDLYLLSKEFPPGSEIILAPGINVPGMLHVMRHHQLNIISVDLPCNQRDRPVVGVDVEAVAHAISPRTVAVLVTHPFGIVCAGEASMRRLKALSLEYKIDLLEDCAECYTGLGEDCYKGSPHADMALFSFGFIKTATALGGGIAISSQPELIEDMCRKQASVFGDQNRGEYLVRVVIALLIRFLCDMPLLYGIVYYVLTSLGFDFDKVVHRCVRGFPMISDNNSGTEFDPVIKRIRRRPSVPLLSVLCRRFEHTSEQLPGAKKRLEQCNGFSETVKHLFIPLPEEAMPTHWLFPIVSNKPRLLCTFARRRGFDITQGSSQLVCTGADGICTRASQMMDHIVYLPVTSGRLNANKLANMRQVLETHSRTLHDTSKSKVRQPLGTSDLFLVILLLATAWCLPSGVILWRLWLLFLSLLVSFYLIQLSMSSFYLETSDAFSRYLGDIEIEERDHEPDNILQFGRQPDENYTSEADLLDISGILDSGSKTILLTGCTGFIGSALLRELLYHRKKLGIAKVLVLCRPKRKRSSEERVEKLLSDPMFSFLTKEEKANRVVAIQGDVTFENAAIESSLLDKILADTNVSHLIHCAAAVSFTQSMEDAARANISSALFMQKLAGNFVRKNVKFVHISTAFVHGSQAGERHAPLDEELFPLGDFDAEKIYQSMMGTQFYAASAMRELGFPNTYTFSKCICEHLLLRSAVQTLIIRPSIVGPALRVPSEGWAGSTPSTLVAAACLYFVYQWNLWYFGSHVVPCIPVDILSKYVLKQSFEQSSPAALEDAPSSDDDFERLSVPEISSMSTESERSTSPSPSPNERSICNATWDVNSARHTQFTWVEYAVAVTQLGSVMGNFSRLVANIGLMITTRLLPRLNLSLRQYEQLHWLLVLCPFRLLLWISPMAGFDTQGLKRLQSFLDLPLLFFPFTTRDFYFKSDLIAPDSMRGDRYLFSCTVAAHKFIQRSSPRQRLVRHSSSLEAFRIAGSLHSATMTDITWAVSQPRGGLAIRCLAWVVAKILRLTCDEVTVDLKSFASAVRNENKDVQLVLAPTHRSFSDFILVSFLLFSIPELQIDLPFIAAASEFADIPFINWMVQVGQAFFVKRNRGRRDPMLAESIRVILRKSNSPVVEVFTEGRRSRDRRFLVPKTGFLKCLHDQCSKDLLIIPLAISYERIPEQSSLSREASSLTSPPMNLQAFAVWIWDCIQGKIHLGRAHIAACAPIILPKKSLQNFSEMVLDIQCRQQNEILVSSYHIECGAKALGVNTSTLETTLDLLGSRKWQETKDARKTDIPDDISELWSVFLQCSHLLVPLVRSEKPQWGDWLCHSSATKAPSVLSESVSEVRDALISAFDAADSAVNEAIRHLKENGFDHPTKEHVFHVAKRKQDSVPLLLLLASLSFHSLPPEKTTGVSYIVKNGSLAGSLLHSEERLGFWGHADSSFVVSLDRKGTPLVTMTGGRHRHREDYIRGLVGFIECETGIKINPMREAFRTTETARSRTISDTTINAADVELLRNAVKQVSVADDERLRHGTGHAIEDVFQIRNGDYLRVPDVVVWPANEDEVESVVNLAVSRYWCIIPFGGGTNVSHATRCPPLSVEPRPILSINLSLLKNILWVDHENRLVHVQAGIRGGDLAREMKRRGYTIGHEPDSIEFSTLGGWIGTKASGMKRSKYGNIEDIVKSVSVITPRGRMSCGDSDQSVCGRTSTGMDLSSLVFGSEGCLGIISSAVIKIWPLPESQEYDGILFTDFSTGIDFVRDVARMDGEKPASCRLLDNEHFRLGIALRPESKSVAKRVKSFLEKLFLKQCGFQPDRCACVTLSYEGSKAQIEAQKLVIQRLTRKYGGLQIGRESGKNGYDLTFLIAYLRDFALSHHLMGESFETFAPWSTVSTMIENVKRSIVREHESRCLPGKPFVGCRVTQLYDEGACLYFYLCMSFDGVPDPIKQFSEIEHMAREVILDCGGSLSHHHGVGKLRASFLSSIQSKTFQEVQQKIKEGLDPLNIFGARNGAFAEMNVIAGSSQTEPTESSSVEGEGTDAVA